MHCSHGEHSKLSGWFQFVDTPSVVKYGVISLTIKSSFNFQNMSQKSRSGGPTLQEIHDILADLRVYTECPPNPNDHKKVFS